MNIKKITLPCGNTISSKSKNYRHNFYCNLCHRTVLTIIPNHCPECYFALKNAHEGENHKSIHIT